MNPMPRLGVACCLWLLPLLVVPEAALGQPLYFSTSSSELSRNTLDRVVTNGANPTVLLTATGPGANNLNRCTALAVDGLNGKLFLVDVAASALWSVNLDGSGLALVKGGLTDFPTDLALDVLNERIYYTTSSTLQSSNTIQRVDYTGANDLTLFTATGASPGNGVSRCTAIAFDTVNSKLFIVDAGARKIWSMSLAGGGLLEVAAATNAVPTGLALDPTTQQVYFTVGSPDQGSNHIMRVSYTGGGLTDLFTAAGSVQRCTALEVDAAHSVIYLSDAGANTLWRIPLGGGSATSVLTGLAATARKVRWFSGPTSRPAPGLAGIGLSGQNILLSATNGFVGGTYYVLTSTNVALPLKDWSRVATNVLAASGNFNLSVPHGFVSNDPSRFFILQVQ